MTDREWCEYEEHEYDEPGNPDTYCQQCGLAVAQIEQVNQFEAEIERLQYKVEARDKEIEALLRVIDKFDALKGGGR